MYDLNDILNTDNPLETFRILHSDILIDKLNNLIINCNDCKTNFEKRTYYGNSNANILIINDTAFTINISFKSSSLIFNKSLKYFIISSLFVAESFIIITFALLFP